MSQPPRAARATAKEKPAKAPATAPASAPWGAAFLDRALGLVVAAMPFGVALSRAASSGQWRDDLPAVRDLGLVSVGVGGGLSTVAAQAMSLVPLGSRTFRASVGSALALGLAAWLTYRLAVRVLGAAVPPSVGARAIPARSAAPSEAAPPSKLAALLAAVAALTAALSPAWQLEGTVGGGAMYATCAALGAVTVALQQAIAPRSSARAWVLLGALSGAAFAESPAAGLCGVAAAAVAILVPRLQAGLLDRADRAIAVLLRRRVEPARPEAPSSLPHGRALAAAGLAAVVTAALLLAPVALRPLAPRAWADLGRFLSTASVAALDTPATETSALSAWSREIGLLSLVIALGGAVLAFLRPRTRAPVAALLSLVALDTLLPARLASFLTADPFAALRCLAIAALAVGSASGVHELTLLLRRARVPLARPAGVLVVMFHVTLIALTSEEAAVASDRDAQVAAEVWTDEAYGGLPPRAAVLARSPAIAWRLWAARIVRGERPDVLIVPAPLLGRGRVTEALLSNERATSLLLRDMALTGAPTEHALSALADARPLFVELFPGWRDRLYRHLSANGMWLEYAAEPRGPSDRKLALMGQAAALSRVLSAAAGARHADPSTSAVVWSKVHDQAAVLLLLGELETAQTFLAKVAEITPAKNMVTAAPARAQAQAPAVKRQR